MAQNPYQPPGVDLGHVGTNAITERGLVWLLFSMKGRASRWDYWKATILLFGLATILLLLVFVPIALSGSGNEADPTDLAFAAFGLVMLPVLWSSIAVSVKRWHDRNKSGAWVLIGFVPYIGSIWTFIECGCLKGTSGPNRYGLDPTS